MLRVIIVTNMFPSHRSPHKGIFVAEQVDALRRHHRIRVIDVGMPRWLGYVWGALRLIVTTAVFRPHVIHVHYGLTGVSVLPIMTIAKRLGIRFVVTFHGTDMLGPVVVGRWVSKLLARSADAAIAVSEEIYEMLRESTARRYWIPCGVDAWFFQGERRKPEAPLFVFPSNPRRRVKNVELFQRAVGEFERRTGITAGTVYLANMSRKAVRDVLCNATALVMTSLREGSPQVVKEALACNLPVISTPVGDVPTLLSSLPYCVVTRDLHDMAEAMAGATEAPCTNSLRGRADEYRNELISDRVSAVYRAVLKR